jgi:hypothetical protein
MTRKEVERCRDEILGKISRLAHPFPTAEAIAAHNAALASLHAELTALPQPEGEIGEAAGILAIGRGWLGDPWSGPPRQERVDPDADHPLLREFGSQIK